MVEIFLVFGGLYCLILLVGAAIRHPLFVDPPVWTGWFWWPAIWRRDFEPNGVRIIVIFSSLGGILVAVAAWQGRS
jgi:hypothetical protein